MQLKYLLRSLHIYRGHGISSFKSWALLYHTWSLGRPCQTAVHPSRTLVQGIDLDLKNRIMGLIAVIR